MKPTSKLAPASEMDVEIITPEKAALYLKMNFDNRPVRENVIERYGNIMKNSQWELNGEAIKFDTEGHLLDGQHRLMAILKSGASIETYVVRDLPRKVFDTLDTGKNRNAGDNLALAGYKNYNALASVLRLIIVEEKIGLIPDYNTPYTSLITTRDIMECVEENPEVLESVDFICNRSKLHNLVPRPPCIYCHYRFSQKDRLKADDFFTRLKTGENLSEGDPILALRNKLIMLKGSRLGTKVRVETIAVIIKAWNFYRKKQVSKTVVWRTGEEFPKPI